MHQLYNWNDSGKFLNLARKDIYFYHARGMSFIGDYLMGFPAAVNEFLERIQDKDKLWEEMSKLAEEAEKRAQSHIVFLDLRHWIDLFEVNEGRKDSKNLRDLLAKIKRFTADCKLTIVLNATHIWEAFKGRTESLPRARRLVRFMLEISSCYFLVPWLDAINSEVESLVLQTKGSSNQDPEIIQMPVMGKGREFLFGERRVLLNPNGKIYALETLEWTVLSQNIDFLEYSLAGEQLQASANASQKSFEEFKQRSEQRRLSEKVPPGMVQRNWYIAQILFATFKPILEKNLEKHRVNPDLIFPEQPSPEKMTALVDKIPTLDCLVHLQVRWSEDRNAHFHKMEANDYFDIAGYAVAIPYCNCIVGEKYFTSVAQKEGLFQKYGRPIFQKLEQLNEWLDKEIKC